MAFCPQCNAEIDVAAVRCASCGYGFPTGIASRYRSRLVHSGLGDFSLALGQTMAILGCIGTLFGMIIDLVNFEFASGLVVAPLQFCVFFALFVTFARVAEQG